MSQLPPCSIPESETKVSNSSVKLPQQGLPPCSIPESETTISDSSNKHLQKELPSCFKICNIVTKNLHF